MTAISSPTKAHEAVAFLVDAYRRRLRRDGKRVEHPLAVGRLLRQTGHPEGIVLAGFLHDTLEDTTVSAEELRERFGSEVTRLVQALTEDRSIGDHRARKAALRRQVLDAGPLAATIAVADKAAKLIGEQGRPSARRMQHYRATLEGVEGRYGNSRLSSLLREQLARCDESA
jgi:(p)ppGpp synthase/HD superfamily hydrolase